MKKQSERYCQ